MASLLAQYEDLTCELSISAPAPGVILLTISGHDVGAFGRAPMADLERHLGPAERVTLFIDARRTQAASIDVSSEWAQFLREHRSRFDGVNMLTGSRFVQITASFVRSFSGLEDVMRIYTDAEAFDEALAAAVATSEN